MGCSNIEGLANRMTLKYFKRGFWLYLGPYCNTVTMKSVPKLGAENKLE